MPTIVKEDGFSVMIMPNDHRPPHVHVFKASGHARITIGDTETRPRLLEVINMKNQEIIKAMSIVLAHQAKLSEAWRKIHA
ncbi:MAG: DUF4160 domain-containing protein [Erysipelotrichia bacterium]|nr:DUF4160 domain-containing protein [Erysipelotrichia bacterium]